MKKFFRGFLSIFGVGAIVVDLVYMVLSGFYGPTVGFLTDAIVIELIPAAIGIALLWDVKKKAKN